MEEYCKHLIYHFGTNELCNHAAKTGNLELLKWARAPGREYSWSAVTSMLATHKESFDVLKWAVENGCPVDETITEIASARGYLEIFKWALYHGKIPIGSFCSANAACGGHILILKLLNEHGHFQKNDYWTFFYAVTGHKWNIVEWMIKCGYEHADPVCVEHDLKTYYVSTSNLLKIDKQSYVKFTNYDKLEKWVKSIKEHVDTLTYNDLSYLIKSFV
jgi:hypothetical protein